MRIVLAGATGFLGRAVTAELRQAGHELVLLTRDPGRVPAAHGVTVAEWDGKTPGEWARQVDGAGAVVNLAGEPIAARRWTAERKGALAISRIQATKAVVAAIAKAKSPPGVLVNASAVGYYGDVPVGDVPETHPKGSGFLADLCEAWERAARTAEEHGVRVVSLRIGVALGRGGGAVDKMLPPFKLFAGGPLGSGRQWFPWVHRDDVAGVVSYAISDASLSGPVNVAAPEPATMKEFCAAFGRALGRPSWAPVPAFVLRLMLGEMAGMLLTGQRAVPARLAAAGYRFRHPALAGALEAVFREPA